MSEEAKTYNIMDLVSQSYIVAVNGSDLQQDGRGINIVNEPYAYFSYNGYDIEIMKVE